jgi:hypothetical protein
MPYQQYKDCIEACAACAVACDNCVTSCLGEASIEYLKRCIQLDMECAAICRSAAVMMSLGSTYSSEILEICADICRACADECEKHAAMGMEHCRICANACRECAAACEEMAEA